MRLATAFLLVLLCGPAVAQTLVSNAACAARHARHRPAAAGRSSIVGPGTARPPCRRCRRLALCRDLELPAFARRHPAGQERAHRAPGLHARRRAEVSRHAARAGGRRAERLQCRIAGRRRLPVGRGGVFLSSSNTRVALPQDEHSVTTLYRIDANGRVQSAASVLPAANASGAFYRTRFYLPTADNGLLVGGGYGPDPFNWWIGKFDCRGPAHLAGRPGTGLSGRRLRPCRQARRQRVGHHPGSRTDVGPEPVDCRALRRRRHAAGPRAVQYARHVVRLAPGLLGLGGRHLPDGERAGSCAARRAGQGARAARRGRSTRRAG